MARHRFRIRTPLPPLLTRLAHAASTLDSPHHADAIREFGHLAPEWILTRGVLVTSDDDFYLAIQRIATEYLNFGVVYDSLVALTEQVEPIAVRGEIQAAQNEFQCISDKAYFYAGLAFGVTLAELS